MEIGKVLVVSVWGVVAGKPQGKRAAKSYKNVISTQV